MDERELLRQLEEDPERGVALLIDAYGGLLWAVVRGKLHAPYFDASDVEDCVADAIGAFYTARDRYDPTKSSLRTYLTLIARRCAASMLRKRGRQGETLSLDDETLDEAVSSDPTPEEISEKRDRCEALLAAIKALGEPDATILLGKYYFEQSTKELARALSMSPSAVDVCAHRAKKRLLKQLKGETI